MAAARRAAPALLRASPVLALSPLDQESAVVVVQSAMARCRQQNACGLSARVAHLSCLWPVRNSRLPRVW